MFGYDPFVDPHEMIFGFNRPDRLASCFLPCESAAVRLRPVHWRLDRPELRRNQVQESETETEDSFNDECPACLRRKEKKLGKKTKETIQDGVESQPNIEATTAVNSAKHISVQKFGKDEHDRFAVRLNVQGFEPEHIQVKVKDRWLEIEAKTEEKNESSGIYSFRQLHRRYALPDDVNPDHVTSFLSKDGFLRIEAPLPIPAVASQQDTTQDCEKDSSTEQQTNDPGNISTETPAEEVKEQAVTSSSETPNVNSSNEECPAA